MNINGYEIEVIKKRIKHLHLYLLPPDGRLRITCPLYTTKAQLAQFVALHRDWIDRHTAQLQAAQNARDDSAFYLWGKAYPLQEVTGNAFSLTVTEDAASLTVPAGATEEAKASYLKEWYRAALIKEATPLLQRWESVTKMECRELRTRDMKTRWGTCNTKEKRIWLSLRLAKLPKECLNYVVLHELVHTAIPNHGAAFKAALTQYLPDWRIIQKQMKNSAIY